MKKADMVVGTAYLVCTAKDYPREGRLERMTLADKSSGWTKPSGWYSKVHTYPASEIDDGKPAKGYAYKERNAGKSNVLMRNEQGHVGVVSLMYVRGEWDTEQPVAQAVKDRLRSAREIEYARNRRLRDESHSIAKGFKAVRECVFC